VLQFPLRKTSNYTEVTANNQTEYNAILNACSTAEASGQGAITSLNINFPITILTYNISLQQTGSVVITSEKQLFTYMSNVSSTELFSVNYPIVTLAGGTDATVNSDAELQSSMLHNASNNNSSRREFKKLETILVDGRFSTIIYYRRRSKQL
jgi:hypothetical protein